MYYTSCLNVLDEGSWSKEGMVCTLRKTFRTTSDHRQ